MKYISYRKRTVKDKEKVEMEILEGLQHSFSSFHFKNEFLIDYCDSHCEISYFDLYRFLLEEKRKAKDLSDEDIISIYIKTLLNQDTIYFSLLSEMRKKTNVSCCKLYVYLLKQKEKSPSVSEEELIQRYLQKGYRRETEYYYHGIALSEYTKSHPEIQFLTIKRWASRQKKQGLFTEESINQYIDNLYEQAKLLYYQGIPLREYCMQHAISLYDVIHFVSAEKKHCNQYDELKIVQLYLSALKQEFFFRGESLKNFCQRNPCIAFRNVIKFIVHQQLEGSKISTEDLMEFYILDILEPYEYQGIPLKKYCVQENIDYYRLRKLIKRFKKQNYENENLIEIALQAYASPQIFYSKFIFSKFGTDLRTFCGQNGYSYQAILLRIERMQQNSLESLGVEDVVYQAVQEYEEKIYFKKIRMIFETIAQQKYQVEELESYLSFLGISKLSVYELTKKFPLYQSILLIWYYGEKNEQGNLEISYEQLMQKRTMLYSTANEQIYNLIREYHCGFSDKRSEMVELETPYIHALIGSICKSWNVKLSPYQRSELLEDVIVKFLELLERVTTNQVGKLVSYLSISLKGVIFQYCKAYINTPNVSSLFYEDKERKERVEVNKRISINSNQKDFFDDTVWQAFEQYSQLEQRFLLLRYAESYSREEISELLEMPLFEIIRLEQCLLERIRNDKKIILLLQKQ